MRRLSVFLGLILAMVTAPMAAQARVDVRIDLSSQTMHVRSPDGETHRWAISSGREGYRTPTGVYSAKRLAKVYFSRKYDNAPMPNAIFFRGGYAIHGTNAVRRLGAPASHGCIRLAPGNAAKLFAMVKQSGARIAISGNAPDDGRVYAEKRAKKKIYASRKRAPLYDTGIVMERAYPRASSSWAIDAPVRGDWYAPRLWRLR
ncbi:MAG: L,D-transpeptidase [Beijerinckiaceae bacterium]